MRTKERTRLTLALEPATRVAVRVRVGGAPATARLVLRRAAGGVLDAEHDSDVSDFASGAPALPEFLLPPGSYVLEAERPGARVTREFSLAGEPALRLELELPAAR